LEIVRQPPGTLSGRALLDEDFLRECGWTDFVRYRCDPNVEPPRITASDFPNAGMIPIGV
jgi:hypothetical protein